MPSARAAAPPGPPVRSVTSTLAPVAATVKEAVEPAAPKPTTITSAVSSHVVISAASHGVTSSGSRTASSPRCRRDGSRWCRRARDPYPADRADPARRAGAAGRARTARPGWAAALAYQLAPWLSTWRLTGPDGAVRFAKVDTEGRYPTLRGRVRADDLGRPLPPGSRGGRARAAGARRPSCSPRRSPVATRPTRSGATTSPRWSVRSAAGSATSTRQSVRSGARSASTSSGRSTTCGAGSPSTTSTRRASTSSTPT